MAEKSDSATVAMRIEAVYSLILDGQSSNQIVQYCAEKWSVAERQARVYIASARRAIKSQALQRQKRAFVEHVEIRRHLRYKAVAAGDLRAALEAAKDEAKLFDLYPTERHEVDLTAVVKGYTTLANPDDWPDDSSDKTE